MAGIGIARERDQRAPVPGANGERKSQAPAADEEQAGAGRIGPAPAGSDRPQTDLIAKALEGLDLPTDRPRSAGAVFGRTSRSAAISPRLSRELRELSQRERVPLFSTLLAAFHAFLFRHTGHEELVIGAARGPDVFLSRSELAENPGFRELLAQVHEDLIRAAPPGEIPADDARSADDRWQPRTGLPRVAFCFDAGASKEPVEGRSFPASAFSGVLDDCDLRLVIHDDHALMRCRWEYHAGLFAGVTISRMLDRFRIFLQAIVADPGQRICELALLTAIEHHLVVVEWNRTRRKYPHDGCVHELFEAQVRRTPQATAIAWQGRQVTFQELNAQANGLAHYLRFLGIVPETLVGIALDRSPAMIVALLAVLKAGAGYVPLEPSMPRERLEFVAADSQMRLLLSDDRWSPSLSTLPVPVLSVEGDLTRLDSDSSNPPATACPHNVAYVIYTSGSTGQPKGVIVEHRGLSNYLQWCLETYPTAGRYGAPAHSSWAFDLSVTSLFVPLLSGRPLVLVPENTGTGGLIETLTEHPDFCFIKGTPTHLTFLNDSLSRELSAQGPRALILGGEQLLAEQIDPWRRRAPDTAIFNEYGPTETVVGSCIYRVTEKTPRTSAIPIGRPIANTEVYVLDAQGQPSPIGVWGELYIAGAGVARGYLNLPDLTARKFVPNPFSSDPEARMYRTGDRVRWRADGELEFLGRLDHQVKLNGYRIEPGEIEAVLSEHPQIRQAAVVLREDRPGERHLAAYFSCGDFDDPPTAGAIASWLKRKLPHYMVPSYLIPLDALPLNSNGKIDRRRLPAPKSERTETGQHAAGFNGRAIEDALTDLWEDVLGVEKVGVNDDFYELGGNSIVALRLFAQIEHRFERRLPLALLYRHATVARLAACLMRQSDVHSNVSVVELQPGIPNHRRLFALPTMGGELIAIRKLVWHLGDQTPVYGLQPRLADGVPVEFEKFESTAARFVEGLRMFQSRGPYALVGYSYGGMLAYEMARQLFAQGESVDLLALLDVGPGDEMRSSPPVARLLRSFFNLCRRQSSRLQRTAGRVGRRMASAVLGREIMVKDRRHPRPGLPTQNSALLEVLLKGVSEYAPTPFPGTVTLFTAKRRPLLSDASRDLGWARYALGGVEVHEVPGDHDGILDEPNVRALAAELKECLGRLSQPNS